MYTSPLFTHFLKPLSVLDGGKSGFIAFFVALEIEFGIAYLFLILDHISMFSQPICLLFLVSSVLSDSQMVNNLMILDKKPNTSFAN